MMWKRRISELKIICDFSVFYLDETLPKGTVLVECGKMLLKNGYKVKVLNIINFKKSMHYNPFAYIRSESWTDWKNCWNERSCLWQKTNRTKMTAPTAAPCDIIPLRNSGAGCRKWRKPWSDRQPKTLLPPFIRDYPMKMNCRARVIPSLTKSVFWKATQNRMVLPISNGTRTMDTPVRTLLR